VQHFQPKALRKFLARNNSSLSLTLIGLLFFSFGAYNYYRIRVLSFPIPTQEASVQVGDRPTHISIPSIKIDLDVIPAVIKNGVWDISYSNATFLNSSKAPGENGNIVIYGHNKKLIFGNLPYLSIGQKIIVKTESGKTHEYQVYKKDFVAPSRIDLVSPTDHEELTLFTCWGLFDSQRAVIKALKIS